MESFGDYACTPKYILTLQMQWWALQGKLGFCVKFALIFCLLLDIPAADMQRRMQCYCCKHLIAGIPPAAVIRQKRLNLNRVADGLCKCHFFAHVIYYLLIIVNGQVEIDSHLHIFYN